MKANRIPGHGLRSEGAAFILGQTEYTVDELRAARGSSAGCVAIVDDIAAEAGIR